MILRIVLPCLDNGSLARSRFVRVHVVAVFAEREVRLGKSVSSELRAGSGKREGGGCAAQAAHGSGGVSSWADVMSSSLKGLRELRVGGGGLTDFELMSLRPLTLLTHLDISDSQEVRQRKVTFDCKPYQQ